MKSLAAVRTLGAMFVMAVCGSGLAADNVGRVAAIEGQARYSTDRSTWLPLGKGDVIRSGCVIQTSTNSHADIKLLEKPGATPSAAKIHDEFHRSFGPKTPPESSSPGNADAAREPLKLRVSGASILLVEALSTTNSTAGEKVNVELELRSGELLGAVPKLNSTLRYEIKVAGGIAGVREGTQFSVASSGEIKVTSGTVLYAVVGSDATVTTKRIEAGHRYNPSSGAVSELTAEESARLKSEMVGL